MQHPGCPGALHLAQVVADAHGEKASEELGAAFDSAEYLRGLAAWATDRFAGSPQSGEHLARPRSAGPSRPSSQRTPAWFQRTKERIDRSSSPRWFRACWL